MSKSNANKNIQKDSQSADDILASLMDDLKDIDQEISGEALVVDSSSDQIQNYDNLEDLMNNAAFEEDLNVLPDESLAIDSVEIAEESDDKLEFPMDFTAAPDLENFKNSDALLIADDLSEDKGQLNTPFTPYNDEHENNISIFNETTLNDKSESFFNSQPQSISTTIQAQNAEELLFYNDEKQKGLDVSEKTLALPIENTFEEALDEKTVAVAGYAQRSSENYGDKVRVSVGQVRGNYASGGGYSGWNSSDSNLVQAENLRIAQEKILELEKENEKLRIQNEELIAASEIVKERADLLNAQIHDFKSDRDELEQSFKSETSVLKAQLARKEADMVKYSMKIEELDSRIKFDLKKIRVRERELENRLELVRAEKNALVRTKDEQILDLRRKLDQAQLEVESYRQKCVELNKVIDTNQESFKRTTRALRLAMANLELQEENKAIIKKAE